MKNSIKTISVLLVIGLISCSNEARYERSGGQAESKVAAYEESSALLNKSIIEHDINADEADLSQDLEEVSEVKKESSNSENHQNSISSVAAKMVNDASMRFIRKAQLKYKTKSVRNSTYYLEHSVIGLGGIVTNTNLYSELESVKKIAINKDSSLKITTYRMNNNMTIRIPNNQLDSLLKVISKSVLFLDTRIVTASEVSLIELKNNMERNRLADYQSKLSLAIKNKSDKINRIVDAHASILQKKKLEDEATIRNLELDYEVEYSTVNLTLYQASSIDKELIENELNIDEYQPSFFSQLLESFIAGWNALLFFVIQLANLWFIFILLTVGIIIYKRRKK